MEKASTEIKFCLSEKLGFVADVLMAGRLDEIYSITALSQMTDIKPLAVTSTKHDNLTEEEKELCDKFGSVFSGWLLEWTIILQTRRVPNSNKTCDTAQTDCRITLNLKDDIVQGLRSALGKKDVTLQAKIYSLKNYQAIGADTGPANQFRIIMTSEMPIPASNQGTILCLDTNYHQGINDLLTHQIRDSTFRRKISGEVDLILVVREPKSEVSHLGGPPDVKKLVIYKQILDEEILPDTVIIAGDGSEIKCHRSFLAAHCPELCAMFTTDMEEAKTGRVEMLEISEAGVKAFLAYLYHWDLSKAMESCAVALELLIAGHKYNIRLLEKDMRKMFLSELDGWYNMDVAIELYFFVEKLDQTWSSLKEKAVMVLKRNIQQLKDSLTYQELFKRDHQAAMRLFEYTLSLTV